MLTAWPAQAQPSHVLDCDLLQFITDPRDPCTVDLTRLDTYKDRVIPDSHIEITLKVLRTLRDMSLDFMDFAAEPAILLSHAHAWIVDAVQKVQQSEQDNKPYEPIDMAEVEAKGDKELRTAMVKTTIGVVNAMNLHERHRVMDKCGFVCSVCGPGGCFCNPPVA